MEILSYPEDLKKLTEYLYSNYGLDYKNKKVKELFVAVQNVSEILGIKINEVFEQLISEHHNGKTTGLLLDCLKISETYFFREESTLLKICNEVLSKSYLEETKIWCAGCSSGEEPYSLLMMLAENKYTLSKQSLKLDASDINRNLLERAEEGLYTNWSFRNTSDKIKSRYFVKSNDIYKIDSRFTNHVNFSEISLTDDLKNLYPEKINYYDIILCRNVLIYHNNEMRERILDNFFSLLKRGGLLFIGLTEIPFVKKNQYEKILEKEIIYFRKPLSGLPPKSQENIFHIYETASLKETLPKSDGFSENTSIENANQLYHSGEYDLCIIETRKILDNKKRLNIGPEIIRETTILLINSYINIGENATAIKECNRYLSSNKNEHNFYLMLANLYVHSDDNDSAIDNLIKAIYLKPDYIAAHLSLGRLFLNMNDKVSSNKHYQICIKLLKQVNADSIIEDTDGFSAGSLIQVIENILKKL